MNLNLKKPIAFFDIEATGINFAVDKIVEICIIKILPDGSREKLIKRFNPGRAMPKEAEEIHGISDEDVKDCPLFKEKAKEIANFIQGCDLAGFNSNRYDVPMLVEELLRSGVSINLDNRNMIDVQKIFHKMEERTLSAALKFYCSKELDNAHNAEADTTATIDVLMSQLEKYDNLNNDMEFLGDFCKDGDYVDAARRIVLKNDTPLFNFGKHRGQSVVEVFKKEPNYYDWIMKSDFPLHTKQKLTEIKIKSS